MRKIVILMLCFIFLSAVSISAQMRKGAISLNPQIGGYMFEGNQNITSALTYGLGLGYNFDENWAAEGGFNYVDSSSVSPSGEDVKAYVYRLDGLYHFMADSKFVPYLAAGIGAITIDGDVEGDGSDPLFNYGMGIKYFIAKNMAIRGDVRHIITDDPTNNLIYTLGLSYLIGGEEKQMPAAPTALKVTPPPAAPKVEELPPPPPAQKPAPAPKADVASPPPAPEPVKQPVKETKVIALESIYFDYDKATITQEAKTILNSNVKTLKDNPGVKVRVEGHACAHGVEDYNLRLSERRANAVKEYLTSGGISADRITAITYGETRLAKPEVPTAKNRDSQEAKANRRVQFTIVSY